ncbi:Arginine/ornithine antiporter ArcD [hydrothermal vent metagenome]|uniref:Arginine/ornithine antiporter ArcD n=1 Tax=hydrothermal vent metagenome TaxID=652676 RepID=A0A1W1ELD7_9ZZZZ
MEDTLTSLSTWGYIAIAFFSFGGSLVVVAAAGVLSYMGEMNIFIALSIAMISNFFGDVFLFYLGRYHKEDIKPYFKKHKRKIALSTIIMRKYGVWAIFIQKFLYGIKTLIPISMSISKYNFQKFVFYNIFASIFFVLVIGVGSYMAAEPIKELFNKFSDKPWILPLILSVLIGFIWLFLEKMTSKKAIKKR